MGVGVGGHNQACGFILGLQEELVEDHALSCSLSLSLGAPSYVHGSGSQPRGS